jgi:hypothetical protein
VLCENGKNPGFEKLVKVGDVCSLEGEGFALVPDSDSRTSRGMSLFNAKILKVLEGEKVLKGVNESQIFVCNTLCDTMAKAAEGQSIREANGHRPRLTENALLAFSYGKKPGAMCEDMKDVFKSLRAIENKGEIEEFRLLLVYLKLVIREKGETEGNARGEARRVFNQHMDGKGFFSWYLRAKGPEGKLRPTKYYGTTLPEDIDLELDRVHFHPQYVANVYGISPEMQAGPAKAAAA